MLWAISKFPFEAPFFHITLKIVRNQRTGFSNDESCEDELCMCMLRIDLVNPITSAFSRCSQFGIMDHLTKFPERMSSRHLVKRKYAPLLIVQGVQ